MSDLTLWGFDGSTYVRTVKMLLAEKGCADFTQHQVNVLAGEPKKPEHLARHPFGRCRCWSTTAPASWRPPPSSAT